MKKIFGERLQEVRKDKGLTQEQLAKKINIPTQTISSWERGLSEPNSQTQILVARTLDTTVGYLVGETNINQPLKAQEQSEVTGQFFFRFDTDDLNEKEKKEFEYQLEDMASYLVNSIKKRRSK